MSNSFSISNILKSVLNRRNIKFCFLYAVIPALAFYIISLYVLNESGFSVIKILRDPYQQFKKHSLRGFISNVGNFMWVATTTICYFEVISNKFRLSDKRLLLLMLFGSLTFLLGIDDFFMIHDRYINQNYCYGAYACLGIALLIKCHKKILQIDGTAFVLGGSLLALSILTDLIQKKLPFRYHQVQIVEEGFKFLGGAVWLYFSGKVASRREICDFEKP